jgi:hypothetical protein
VVSVGWLKLDDLEQTKRVVIRFEESGGVLLLVGLNCLFIYLMLNTPLSAGVPILSLIAGAGFYGVARLIKKMVPDLA